MKACRCSNCGQVVPAEGLLVFPPDEDEMFTLEDDEPQEWFCPLCFEPDLPCNWTPFYLPTAQTPVAAAGRERQRDLFE